MNRGSKSCQRSHGAGHARFNEAPIHESGKCHAEIGGITRTAYRFNEAPIHESGKSPLRSLDSELGRTGFNEAPIHESGKFA